MGDALWGDCIIDGRVEGNQHFKLTCRRRLLLLEKFTCQKLFCRKGRRTWKTSHNWSPRPPRWWFIPIFPPFRLKHSVLFSSLEKKNARQKRERETDYSRWCASAVPHKRTGAKDAGTREAQNMFTFLLTTWDVSNVNHTLVADDGGCSPQSVPIRLFFLFIRPAAAMTTRISPSNCITFFNRPAAVYCHRVCVIIPVDSIQRNHQKEPKNCLLLIRVVHVVNTLRKSFSHAGWPSSSFDSTG